MISNVRAPVWAIAALVAWSALPAVASDLDIVSTMSFESGGKKYVKPCVHNNTAEVRQAHFKIGTTGVRWSFAPLPVPPGQTACFELAAPPIAPGIANEVHVE
jgi:hypothetical protein